MIILAERPPVFDCHILALEEAAIGQTLAKPGQKMRGVSGYPITGIGCCCARAASGHAAAPPSSVMKSRRLTPSIGLPPLGWATDTYRMLNLAQRGRQVLGADLNCSESRWALSTGLHCHPKR